MKYFEFGKENSEIMALLYGGGICNRAAIPTAEVLAKKDHLYIWHGGSGGVKKLAAGRDQKSAWRKQEGLNWIGLRRGKNDVGQV